MDFVDLVAGVIGMILGTAVALLIIWLTGCPPEWTSVVGMIGGGGGAVLGMVVVL